MIYGKRFFIVTYLLFVPPVMANDLSKIPVTGTLCAQPKLEFNVESRVQASSLPTYQECFVSYENAKDRLLIEVVSTNTLIVSNALHMTSMELFSKSYLKNKSLLVAQHGYELTTSLNLCARAKAAGFQDIKFLEGGLLSTVLRERDQLSFVELQQLAMVPTEKFLYEYQQGAIESLWITHQTINAQWQPWISDFLQVNDQEAVAYELKRKIYAWLRLHGQQAINLVLIADNNFMPILKEELTKNPLINLYLLDSSVEEFQQYINHKDNAVASRQQGLRNKKCSA